MVIKYENNKIYVQSDYCSSFIKGARKLNGKWEDPYWVFDNDDKEYLKKLCIEVYGEFDIPVEKVNITLDMDKLIELTKDKIYDDDNSSFELFGRNIVKRFSRDSDVKLHDSVLIIQGGFPGRGGSGKYPRLNINPNTILKIKNVAKFQADEFKELYPDVIKILKTQYNIEDLKAEKEKLLNRISEIDNILKANCD